ncbi:hypothetical protein [Brachyspira sp. G79]|uniref:hypothetical protein n=1 Tax=Brachyspira sp. G79 TaxID=1358104 RepID=UPI000BBC73C9|nr:hypothetical protein [Brachyspira sp. G79]PCG20566.1 hypothetical protein KQ44_11595 [Brachyspira sp. G79]
MVTKDEIENEVSQNYQFFLREKENNHIPYDCLNKVALLRKQQIIDYFDSIDDALKYARKVYEDGLYSVQKVNDIVINLGYIGSVLNA